MTDTNKNITLPPEESTDENANIEIEKETEQQETKDAPLASVRYLATAKKSKQPARYSNA